MGASGDKVPGGCDVSGAGAYRGFWEQVHDVLRRNLRPADLHSWFADAHVVGLDPTSVTISFPNGFAVGWVRSHFLAELSDAVHQAAGAPLEVELVAHEGAGVDPAAADRHPADGIEPPVAPASGQPPAAARAPATPTHGGADVPPREPAPAPGAWGDEISEAELLAELDAPAAPATTPASAGRPSGRGRQASHDDAFGLRLNPGYRFDTFVIGETNQLAHAAALNVAESPGQSYNPLYIYGPTGLGKTHLLHAIGHYALATRPGVRVAYVTSEQFVVRFIQMIGHSDRSTARRRFKEFFRGIDVLLVDDVQFLADKGPSLQEEFFHTFNALTESGGQVVLTSDCEPVGLSRIEERLRSRFAWGLITDIAQPDRETRIAILHKKALLEGVHVDPDVLAMIGERVTTNVRELEGALTRVIAAASLRGRPITPELAGRILDSFAAQSSEPARELTIEDIQRAVCEKFGLSHEELVGRSRARTVARPRQIAMYLSRTLLGAPSTQIGQRFGGKDHSTVLHAHGRVETLMREDQEVLDMVEDLTSSLRGVQVRVGDRG